ncbi:MAG: hypothetical protein L3J81_04865 [Thermoplasmata archaeon]|jgi:hypothetical protein|nr:hypothetical protein [Thermoplasmata archaeon]
MANAAVGPRPSPPTVPSAVEREAIEYLGREIQPALRGTERRTLARAVRTAVGNGSVTGLARLGERHRRELLDTIEARLAKGRPAPTPRALVRLTSVISAAPNPDGVRSRAVASPAR